MIILIIIAIIAAFRAFLQKRSIMKKVFHVTSCVLSLLLAALGAVLIALRGRMEDEGATIYLFAGSFQIIMGLVIFFTGALLPEEGRKMSKRARKILRVVAAIAALGGKGTSGVAAYNVLNGEVFLQRFWEPAWPLAWLLFEWTFLWFFPADGVLGTAVTFSFVFLVLLIISSFCWSVTYRRESGAFKWLYVLGPSAVILTTFSLVFLFTYISEQERKPALNETMTEMRAEIEAALEEYNSGEHLAAGELEHSQLDMTGIVTMLKNDLSGDIYYRWVAGGEDDAVSLAAWTAESDAVYVYQFVKNDDRYSLEMAFVSSSLTKEDVEGKEDGVIPGSQE